MFTYYIDIKCDSELNTIFEGHGTSDVKHLRSLKMAEYSTRTEFLNPEKVVRLACDLKVTFDVKNQPVSEVKSDMQETLCDFGIQQWAKTTLQERLEFIVKDFREKAIQYYTDRFGLVEDEWLKASGNDAILNGLYEQQKQLDKAYQEALTKNAELLKIRVRQMLEASYNEF